MAEIDEQIRSAAHILGQVRHHLGTARMIHEFCLDSVIHAAGQSTGSTLAACLHAQTVTETSVETLAKAVTDLERLVVALTQIGGS